MGVRPALDRSGPFVGRNGHRWAPESATVTKGPPLQFPLGNQTTRLSKSRPFFRVHHAFFRVHHAFFRVAAECDSLEVHFLPHARIFQPGDQCQWHPMANAFIKSEHVITSQCSMMIALQTFSYIYIYICLVIHHNYQKVDNGRQSKNL